MASRRELPEKVFLASIWISVVFLSFIAVVATVREVRLPFYYPVDIDHEIYFGQELSRGNLIWTVEFHDKLPIVQYLFFLPGMFGSARVWQLLSVAIILLSVAGATTGLLKLREVRQLPRELRAAICFFCGLIVVAPISILPDGISGIHGSAMSLWFLSSVLLLWWGEREGSITPVNLLRLGVVCVPGCMAVSIRPYFLPSLLVVGVFATLFRGHNWASSGAVARKLVSLMIFAASVAIGISVMNFLPYVTTGKTHVLWDGLQMLAADLNPTAVAKTLNPISFYMSPYSLMLPLLALLFFALLVVRAAGSAPGEVIASTFSIVGLFVAVAAKHWWSFYLILFLGPISLLLFFVLSGLFKFFSRTFPKTSRPSAHTLLIIAAISILVGLVGTAAVAFTGEERIQVSISETIRESAESRKETMMVITNIVAVDEQFLAPFDMYAHWKLNEPRHGFPHAANSGHILQGWWKSVPAVTAFAAPTSLAEYCDLLQFKAVTYVVLPIDSALIDCMTTHDSKYEIVTTENFPSGRSYTVFRTSP